jgi:hypothetical protein
MDELPFLAGVVLAQGPGRTSFPETVSVQLASRQTGAKAAAAIRLSSCRNHRQAHFAVTET